MGMTQTRQPQTVFHPLETERYLDDVALAEALRELARYLADKVAVLDFGQKIAHLDGAGSDGVGGFLVVLRAEPPFPARWW